jgi:hypothetical protein
MNKESNSRSINLKSLSDRVLVESNTKYLETSTEGSADEVEQVKVKEKIILEQRSSGISSAK